MISPQNKPCRVCRTRSGTPFSTMRLTTLKVFGRTSGACPGPVTIESARRSMGRAAARMRERGMLDRSASRCPAPGRRLVQMRPIPNSPRRSRVSFRADRVSPGGGARLARGGARLARSGARPARSGAGLVRSRARRARRAARIVRSRARLVRSGARLVRSGTPCRPQGHERLQDRHALRPPQRPWRAKRHPAPPGATWALRGAARVSPCAVSVRP